MNLKELAKTLGEAITEKDFLNGFELLVKEIRTLELTLAKKITERLDKIESQTSKFSESSFNTLKEEVLSDLNSFKKNLDKKINLLTTEQRNFLKDIAKKVEDLEPEEVDTDEIEENILAKIPKVKDGKNGEKPKHEWNGTKIRFENPDGSWGEWVDLKGDKGSNYSLFGGISKRGEVIALDLSSQLDGSTRTFNIQTVWKIVSVHLSSFPNILRPTTDYTWTTQSITLTAQVPDASIASGQTLLVVVALP